MDWLLVFVLELIIISRLSRSFKQTLFNLFFYLTRSKKISIYILSIIFLPGTVFHELSHAVVAFILRVKVEGVSFIPQIEEQSLVLGSVKIFKPDPVRRIIVGSAPLFLGIIGITLLLYYFPLSLEKPYTLIVLLFTVFQVSNTMFLSRQDIRGLLPISIIIVCTSFFFILINENYLHFSLGFVEVSRQLGNVFHQIVLAFLLPIFLQTALILAGVLLKKI